MKYCLFYGSLRAKINGKSGYNFNRFGKNTQKYLKTFRLKNYSLVDLGVFPAAYDDENGEITVELHEIENSWVAESIKWMEEGSGYHSKEINLTLDNKEITATIYLYPPERAARIGTKIESGNWQE